MGRTRPLSPVVDCTARENDRIFRTSDFTGTIELPKLVTDTWQSAYLASWSNGTYYDTYSVQCGKPRPPRDGAFVIINDAVSGNTEKFIYEAYINQWASAHDLNLGNGESPRP